MMSVDTLICASISSPLSRYASGLMMARVLCGSPFSLISCIGSSAFGKKKASSLKYTTLFHFYYFDSIAQIASYMLRIRVKNRQSNNQFLTKCHYGQQVFVSKQISLDKIIVRLSKTKTKICL